MFKSIKNRGNSLAIGLGLGLVILTPLALSQIACSTPAKDKSANVNPSISTLTFADLATPTTPWASLTPAQSGNNWTITAGTSTYLMPSFGSIGGTAVINPGNIPVVTNVPVVLSPSATTVYTLTVTDSNGHTTSTTATLNVVPLPASAITADAAVLATSTGLTASVAGNPAGSKYAWKADNATITSDPTQPTITYTAGSANADGSSKTLTLYCKVTNTANTPLSATTPLNVTVNAALPADMHYASPNAIYYLNSAIQPNVISEDGGPIQSVSISPALPAGLQLDPVTGTITGTPTALSAPATYTVTCKNSGGSVTFPLNLQVQAAPALLFSAPSPSTVGIGGQSILQWTSGSAITAVNITAVPNDPTLTGPFALSGTKNVSPATTTVYTLTASLQGGGTMPPVTQTVTVDPTPLALTQDLYVKVNGTTPFAGMVPFQGGITLAWAFTGTPNTLVLKSPGTSPDITPFNTSTSYAVNPVLRRQNYQLTATNANGSILSQTVSAYAQGLDTLAGNITLGGGSHDGTGRAAQFNSPYNCGVDPSGNLYVPDYNNHVIRMVTPQGVVTTLAGTVGVSGKTDNTTADKAQFNGPRSVAYWQDPATGTPYLFVAEYSNQVIRKITLSGTTQPITATHVQVFYGTIGTYNTTAGFLDNPTSLVIDASGNLYCSEYYSNAILKFTGLNQTTGTLTTYSGVRGSKVAYSDATPIGYNQPNTLAIDPAGNIYVSELAGNRIRKITPAGVVSTVAGDNTAADLAGVAGFVDGPVGTSRINGASALAVSKDGTTLFIGDSKNNAVRALNLSTNVLSTVIGSKATNTATIGTTSTVTPGLPGSLDGQGNGALLAGPQGLVVDPNAGTLYISEYGNNDIRAVDTNLNVTTFVGSSPAVGHADGAIGTSQMAINPGLNTGALTTNTKTMSCMTMDASNNIYVSDVYNNAIRMITPAGVMTTIAGTAGLTTAGSTDGDGSAASFNQPSGITFDPTTGNLYVADMNNSAIRMLTYNKATQLWHVATIAGIAGTNGKADGALGTSTFNNPYGITFNAKDNCLYVADTGNASIRKLTGSGASWSVSTLTAAPLTVSAPMGIAADTNGNLYFADYGKDYVGMLAPPASGLAWAGTVIGGLSGSYGFLDGIPTAVKTTSCLFNYPQGVSVDQNGVVWVADYGNKCVRKIVKSGSTWTTTTMVGQGVTSTQTTAVPTGTSVGGFPSTVYMPQSVLVSPAGHDLYITTNGGVAQATSIDGQ